MTRSERIEFPGAHGDLLAARLDLPGGTPRAFALFAHCFTCSKDYKAVARISRLLAERGIAVCRFDFTGLGESGGDFSSTNFSSNLDDLEAAARYLRSEWEAPRLLIGHSLGGAAVLAVTRRIPETAAVVTIAAPSDTEQLGSRLLRAAPELAEREEAMVTIAGRTFRVRRQLLADLRQHRMDEYLAELDRPLLILHSPQDEIVDMAHAERLFALAGYPKNLITIDGADHLLSSNRDDWPFVADLIGDWVSRYLPAGKEADGSVTKTSAAEVVATSGRRGFETTILAGRHQLIADEPISLGGTDRGPNPYSFLLAALGSCIVITLQMYADRKGWSLDGVRVALTHSRIHVKDCEDCQSTSGRIDRIEVNLSLEGDLTESQIEGLIDIAGRCPVHRSLSREVSIRTTTL